MGMTTKDDDRVRIDAASIDDAIGQLVDQIGGDPEDAYADIVCQIDLRLKRAGYGRLMWVNGIQYPVPV